MCGRYYNTRQKQELVERVRAKKVFEEPYAPNYNIAPTTFQPILRLDRDNSERELAYARWGLIPFFAKALADFKTISTFNAKAENLLTSGTWRVPFERRRCAIPADGFYEWKSLGTSVKGKPSKQPYNITLAGNNPLYFAGLWDAWKEPKNSPSNPDTWLQSFSIITVEANEIMSQVHTRMPAILPARDLDEWLDRDTNRPPPQHLLRPFDSDAMELHPCSPAVGNVRNNSPELLVCPTPDTPPLNSA